MSAEDYEGLKGLRQARQAEADARRSRALVVFQEIGPRLVGTGLTLIRHTQSHYQIRHRSGWILDLYPGNQRIYRNPTRVRSPHLKLPRPWSLGDVIDALTSKEGTIAS